MLQVVSILIPSVEHPFHVPPLTLSSSVSITRSPDADPLVTVDDSGSSLCVNREFKSQCTRRLCERMSEDL